LPAIVPCPCEEIDEVFREAASERQNLGVGSYELLRRGPAVQDIGCDQRPVDRKAVAVLTPVPGVGFLKIQFPGGLGPSRKNRLVSHSVKDYSIDATVGQCDTLKRNRMWKYLEYVEDYRRVLRQRQDSRYLDYPYQVSFETLALCNATCDFCPYPNLSRKGASMSDALIGKIIEQCRSIPADLPFQIVPLRVNEPFLDKRIFSICKNINEKLPNAEIQLFSNGSPLNAKNLAQLIEIKNVARLVISLHENRPDVYERVLGIPFGRTLRNVEALHGLKVSGAIEFPVEISRVGDGSAYDEEFCRWGQENRRFRRSVAVNGSTLTS
jgi:sulfatase maturation enzyme AslB (radical SAM superfamily)